MPIDDDVKVDEKTELYAGYLTLERYVLRHRLHRGGHSEPLQRELVSRGHAVGVLPYDPDRDAVVLIEQFRLGAYAAEWDPWHVEIIAGMIEDGENAENVARREAVEEAGCALIEMEQVARFLMSPGILSQTMTVFCGRVNADKPDAIYGLEEEGEDIRAFTVGWEQISTALDAGNIINGPALIALQWLALHRGELREKWGSKK